jgi:hypothetical protein
VGEGSWGFVANKPYPWITGDQALSGQLVYQAGATAWPATGGLLTIFFPAGIDPPTASNFYVAPSFASKVQSYSFSGTTVEVQVKDLLPGAFLPFFYGYNSTGFAVVGTNSPINFGMMAYVDSVSAGPGSIVTPASASAPLLIVTPTMTATISATFTVSPTFSETPTVTPTFTITETFTETPVGPEQVNTVYSYPNPFDQKKFDKCTFRFPSAANAQVTVFNLVGEPVREIPSSDINAAQGWAVWPGVDDYMRKVTGGLYFVRVRLPNSTMVKKFTVLF